MNNNMLALRSFNTAAIADAGLAWSHTSDNTPRTRQARPAKIVLGALAVALAATACTPAAANNAEAGTGAAASNVKVQEGPLTEMLNGALGLNMTPAEQQRQYDEQRRHEEEMIAQCMTNAGFEYRPNISTSSLDMDEMYRPNDREWVAQYGFATVRVPWEQGDAQASHVDPNAEYLAGLSAAELAAFNSALYGAMADMNYVGAEDMGDVEALLANAGCWGEAQQRSIEESPAATFYTAEFAPLTEAIMAFFENLKVEITEADREWVTCMANAGHAGFQRQSDARASIEASYDEVMGSFNWEAWDVDAHGYPSPSNNSDLADLAEKEINLALADYDCRATTDFDARRAEFQVAAEKQFVSDHKSELAAVQAAVEQR